MAYATRPDLVFLLLCAPFVGSFLGVVVSRWPSGDGILFGRSLCACCGHRLGPRDLVPLASWLALRGRCRHCAAPIGAFAPTIELAALVVALWSLWALPGGYTWVGCALGWTLLAAAFIDARCQRLPDAMTLPLILSGLAFAAWTDPASGPDHGAGAAAGYLAIVLIARAYRALRNREGIGLGDAKLLAAAGAWVSWTGLPSVVLIASLGALASTAVGALLTRRLPEVTARIALGPYLAGGLWLVWLYGPLAPW
ncbi:prepilin peptidase [Azospirillum canadense]|uniref:prepilin peptidase n=1 Tax=Azospirillum canadense TaxID=403962 RepID=UPI00222780AB|nr:A24 family peptidase [Azospirillum canadense]MCW2239561.1 leader peptidase (prepilin peptidase)/N-methyltransferase [Azospirillum canadense]